MSALWLFCVYVFGVVSGYVYGHTSAAQAPNPDHTRMRELAYAAAIDEVVEILRDELSSAPYARRSEIIARIQALADPASLRENEINREEKK